MYNCVRICVRIGVLSIYLLYEEMQRRAAMWLGVATYNDLYVFLVANGFV